MTLMQDSEYLTARVNQAFTDITVTIERILGDTTNYRKYIAQKTTFICVIDDLFAQLKTDRNRNDTLLRRHNELKTQRIQLESQNKALSKKLQAIQYEKELFTKERKHLDKQKQSLRERQYTWNQKVIELSQHIETHYDKQPQPSTDISEQPKHETIPPNDVKPKHEQQRNYRKFPTNKTHVTRDQNNSYYHQKPRHYYERHNTYSRPHYRERTRQYYQPHNTYYGYQRTYYRKARYYERPRYYRKPYGYYDKHHDTNRHYDRYDQQMQSMNHKINVLFNCLNQTKVQSDTRKHWRRKEPLVND